MLPIPRPVETSDDIRKELKNIAEASKKRQLEYAAEIKKTEIPGEKSVGWRFPKEDKIHEMWTEWNKVFDAQKDLVAHVEAHFEDARRRITAKREAEKKEMEGGS